MRRTVFPAVVMLMLTQGCQPAPDQLTDEQKMAVMEPVFGARAELMAAGEQVDAERVLDFFAEDVGVAMSGEVMSRRILGEAVRTAYAGLDGQILTWHPAKVSVLTRNAVVMTLGGSVTGISSTGDTTSSRPVAWTEVWVRQDGDWKILHAHQSFTADEGSM